MQRTMSEGDGEPGVGANATTLSRAARILALGGARSERTLAGVAGTMKFFKPAGSAKAVLP